jgi:hypothetical protein
MLHHQVGLRVLGTDRWRDRWGWGCVGRAGKLFSSRGTPPTKGSLPSCTDGVTCICWSMFFMGPREKLNSLAMDILDQIVSSQETKEGKGMIVFHGYPGNNEGTACVFSLRGGTTVGYRPRELCGGISRTHPSWLYHAAGSGDHSNSVQVHRQVTENASSERTRATGARARTARLMRFVGYHDPNRKARTHVR